MQQRITWIDAARGLAVTLVVLFHFLLWFHPQTSPLEPIWEDVRFVTGRLRMPILMAISGYLAASSIAGGWGRTRVRVAANYWIYLVWLSLYVCFYAVLERAMPGTTFPMAVSTIEDWVTNLLLPDTILWFVLALAVFPVIILVMRKSGMPWWMILSVAAATWAWGMYTDIPDSIGKLARTFIFFVIGCFAHGRLNRIPRIGIVGAVSMTIAFMFAALNFPRAIEFETGVLAAALFAMLWCVTTVPVLVRWKPLGTLGSFVGSRTVEIYVLHLPLLILLSLAIDRWPVPQALVSTPAGDLAYVIVGVVAVIALSIGSGAALRRIPGNPLLSFPWKDRIMPPPVSTREGQTARNDR